MKRFILLVSGLLAFACTLPALRAQPDAPPPASASTSVSNSSAAQQQQADATLKTDAAAVVVTRGSAQVRTPDFLEHLVDEILALFNVRNNGNTPTHWAIFGLLLVGGLLLRRIVTGLIFRQLKRLAARTQTTLDDKLFPALEAPVATFVMLVAIFAAFKVLKLSPSSDQAIGYGSTVAFSLALFWGLLRAFSAVLDHAQEIAVQRNLGVAAFMPWIKKTLMVIFVTIGVLLTAQSLGADVKAFLAGLGIGGLAFALAAQDTIANLFGSLVVAIDQPFKIGEVITIGANTGTIEDIGLRSTKLRKVDKSLVIIPNKTVAAETITNLSRITQRRVEQTLNLTYDSPPDQVEGLIADLRGLIESEPQVDKKSIAVFFNAFSPSSLDVFLAYMTVDANAATMLEVRQRLSMKFIRALEARKLSFAFPTQTVELGGELARQLAQGPARPPTAAS